MPSYRPPGHGQSSPGGPQPRLLIGLVLVLLAACGGLAFASWRVVDPDGAPTASAAGSPWSRASSGPSSPAPGGTAPGGGPPSPSVAPSPSGPAVAPAGSAPVPFGISHVVSWPDHLQAVVRRARRYDLPDSQVASHPSDVAVLVTIEIRNNTATDVAIGQARLRLWYGDDRRPAEEFVDVAANLGGGLSNTIRSGGKVVGDFAFVVPPRFLGELVAELVPRPGDVPGSYIGSVG